MDTSAQQILQLQQFLDHQSGELVQRAEKALPDERMKQIKGDLRLGQFNNLLGVALETDSPQVVHNWLLYQMGRSERNVRPWQTSGLGAQVDQDMLSFEKEARRIAGQVYGASPEANQVDKVHIVLVRRYLGYLRRWFVAKGGQA